MASSALSLLRDFRSFVVPLHIHDQLLIAAEMISGNCAVDALAEEAIVLRGNIGGDELTLTRRESARPAQQDLHQFVQRLRGLRTKRQWAANPRQAFGQRDVRHDASPYLTPWRFRSWPAAGPL